MSGTRRKFFQDALLFSAGVFGWSRQADAQDITSAGGTRTKKPVRNPVSPKSPIPVVTPDVPDLPFELDGAVKVFRLKAEPLKTQDRSLQDHRRLGLQRQLPRPYDPDQPGRPRAHHRRKRSSGKHFHALARTGSPHRPGRRPVDQPETHSSRRLLHLRIHSPSGRHFLLPRP